MDYARAADELDTFVVVVSRPACGGREFRPDQVLGFVTLKETSEDALETPRHGRPARLAPARGRPRARRARGVCTPAPKATPCCT